MNITIKNLKNKGAFHIVAGSFITKFVSFFGSIFLVRILTKSEYGILSYYENFVSYFVILLGYGLVSGLLRYMVLLQSMVQKKMCFIYALKRGSAWNFFLILMGCLLITFYPHPTAFSEFSYIGIILIIGIPFVYFTNLSLSSLRALFANKAYALLSFVSSTILIVARVFGAMIDGLDTVAITKLSAEIISTVLCLGFLWKKFFNNVSYASIPKQFSHELNVYSLQMMLTDGLWAVFMLNDLFLLGQFSGNEIAIANYKVAYVIPANLSLVTSAVGVFIAPFFTKYENKGDIIWIREKISLVLKITVVIMAIASIICLILAKPLIILLYGKEYLTIMPIMRILLLASFFNNGIRATIANILSAIGIQKINLFIASGGIFFQIILDICLIPNFGEIGVAYSNMIVYAGMSIALGIVTWYKYFKNKNQ